MADSLTILGSTGSIGESTLRVQRALGDRFSVYGLACSRNIERLDAQIEEFHPSVVAVGSREVLGGGRYREMKKKHDGIEFLEGEDGVVELAGRKTGVLVAAIVGAAGLKPTLAAIGSAGRIALANKETLVMAGDLVMDMIGNSHTELVPVDSEHSALFSLLHDLPAEEIERVILTASGGSLRNVPVYDLDAVDPETALNHPTWDMGDKITIDSATLMNKGFEVIEAHYLFDLPYDKIDILIHPESVVHSIVETIDGALYAHMGVADMAFPITGALTYPHKMKNPFGRLRLEEVGALNFRLCDKERYPGIDLCYHAGKKGGTMPAVLNGSNETAVRAFLEKKILFTDIVKIVEKAMECHEVRENPSLAEIFQADRDAREYSQSLIKGEHT